MSKDMIIDGGGCPVLTPKQTKTILYLFEHGPDYVYSLKDKVKINQQTLDALVKRLEALGLVCVKDTVPVDKGRERKIYALTRAGFCAAVLLALGPRQTSLVGEKAIEAIRQGITIYKGLFFRGDFGYVSLILKRWESILRAAGAYPVPADIEDHRPRDALFRYRMLPRRLAVPKTDPRWVWHAALYRTCLEMFDSCYVDNYGAKYVPGELFDMIFLSYILNPDPRESSVFAARIAYFCNVLRTDVEMSEFLEVWIDAEVTELAAICDVYRDALVALKKEEQ